MNATGHSIGCSCAVCVAGRNNTAILNRDHKRHVRQQDCCHEDGHGSNQSASGASTESACSCPGSTSKSEQSQDGCSCSEGTENIDKTILARIITAAILLVLGVFIDAGQWIKLGIFLVGLVVIGYDIIYRAVNNLLKNRFFDENLLMSLACIGAFCIGEYAEGMLVMLLYQVGEMFQDYATGKSRQSIRSLVDLRPETVNVLRENEIVNIAAESCNIGDIMAVKPGERIALDGIIIEGETTLDTSALTGESLARPLAVGESVFSGCVNLSGLIKVKVTAGLEQSAVSRIMELVEEAAEKKAEPEKFITKFAKVYTPVVFIAAVIVAIAPPLLFGQDWYSWIYRALTFLVISCPCALVISVPLTYFAGIGGASKKGVLFKGSNSMDVMSRVGTVVFDKTGTLTTGRFQVTDVKSQSGVRYEKLLETAAYAESFSDHPLACSIVTAYGREIDKSRISEYSEERGKGVSAFIDGSFVMAGNKTFMEGSGIEVGQEASATTVHVASDGKYMGRIELGDTNKPDAAETVNGLKNSQIGEVMITGDNKEAASKTADSLGISEFYAQCLPEDKSRILGDIIDSREEAVAFVGDGINDAPVLTMADVGIAMGGLGADAAIEAADVVIMNDEPSKILTAINSAVRTNSIVKQNIAFALVVKAIFLVLGVLGYSAMATAIFADVGVSLLAILNAMRASK